MEKSEANGVESPSLILPDSPGYYPTSPKGVSKSPSYSPTLLEYYHSKSLYPPTTSSISFDGDL